MDRQYRYRLVAGAVWRWRRLSDYAGSWTTLRRPPAGLRRLIAAHPHHREFLFDPRSRTGRAVPGWEEISA
jgi:hypothetical protein